MNLKVVDRTYVPESAKAVRFLKKKEYKAPEYKAEKIELSSNIKKFDSIERKSEIKTQVLSERLEMTPTATELVYQSIYNKAGKLLGVDSVAEWSKNYDKVYDIVEQAKNKLGVSDEDRILGWIYKMINAAPSITDRKLNDLRAYLALGKTKSTNVIKNKVIK